MELDPVRAVNAPALARPERPAVGAAKPSGFSDALGEAIQGLDETQLAADRQSEALARGSGNLHETALALEKADLTMRLATKVRNRFVDAYQEIMRMNV